MSSTELIEFIDGVANECHEFKNSWGGAARIWHSLFEKYIPKKMEYDSWLSAGQDGRLWEVWQDERLTDAERIVYWFTCDNALVKNEDFASMAASLRGFAKLHPVDGKVCHLESFAKVFDTSDAEAIGLYATTVNENPWFEWNEEEKVPYSLATGNKHWFVFDRLRDFFANV